MNRLLQSLSRRLLPAYAFCIVALAALLLFSPAEATLGSVVKLVYLHGALQRVSVWAYAGAALVGIALLALRRPALTAWSQALTETALIFWVAHFAVSVPAQMMAWGGIAWNEPRVAGAIWIASVTAIVYVVALWIERPRWWALAALANFGVVLVILQGAVNILHPLSPILSSDSAAIKGFYGAIVLVSVLLGIVLTVDLERRADLGRAPGAPLPQAGAGENER